MKSYLPSTESNSLQVVGEKKNTSDFSNEREILYKVLFDMKQDINDLKKIIADILQKTGLSVNYGNVHTNFISKYGNDIDDIFEDDRDIIITHNDEKITPKNQPYEQQIHFEEENLSIQQKEIDLIKRALEKYHGKKRKADKELGISERTLYRKLKEFNINF